MWGGGEMSVTMSDARFRAQTNRGELPGLTERIDRHLEQYVDFPEGRPVQGRPPEPGCVILSSNDYLALATDPRIVQAQITALAASRNEVMMSGVFLDDGSSQRRFERELARFLGAEDVALCQSGYAANDGLIQILADAITPIYIDIFAHMSLWAGAQSAGVKARPFRHNEVGHLANLVAQHGPGIVVVDAIYSTTGDICPLAELVTLCERTGSLLVLDESHSMGTFGDRGEGLAGALGLADRVHFRTFSLSKAFVGRAGVVAGPARVVDFLRYESRPAIFSSAVLEHDIARFRATLQVIEQASDRRTRLAAQSAKLRVGLASIGYDVSISETQIVPLIAGPEARTVALRRALERRDIIGAVFCAPATPKNRSLVRFSMTSETTDAEIDRVLAVCEDIRDEMQPDEWPMARRAGRRVGRQAVTQPRSPALA
jgi:CAI-1 autoinducer synthase